MVRWQSSVAQMCRFTDLLYHQPGTWAAFSQIPSLHCKTVTKKMVCSSLCPTTSLEWSGELATFSAVGNSWSSVISRPSLGMLFRFCFELIMFYIPVMNTRHTRDSQVFFCDNCMACIVTVKITLCFTHWYIYRYIYITNSIFWKTVFLPFYSCENPEISLLKPSKCVFSWHWKRQKLNKNLRP